MTKLAFVEPEKEILKISGIPIPLLDVVWPQVQPIMERATDLSGGEATTQTAYDQLARGDALLITISRGTEIVAVNTLEVREFQTGLKVMCIPITAGEFMDEWLDRFMDVAKQTAREFGCSELRGFSVRKGWLRALKNQGWTDVHQVIRCKL